VSNDIRIERLGTIKNVYKSEKSVINSRGKKVQCHKSRNRFKNRIREEQERKKVCGVERTSVNLMVRWWWSLDGVEQEYRQKTENRSIQHGYRYRSAYSTPSKGLASPDVPRQGDRWERRRWIERLGYNEFWTEVDRRSVSKMQYVPVAKALEDLRGMR